METLSTLLALSVGKSPVTGEINIPELEPGNISYFYDCVIDWAADHMCNLINTWI